MKQFTITENGKEIQYEQKSNKYFKNGSEIYKQEYEEAEHTRNLLDSLKK